jgi:hypothetical protein
MARGDQPQPGEANRGRQSQVVHHLELSWRAGAVVDWGLVSPAVAD